VTATNTGTAAGSHEAWESIEIAPRADDATANPHTDRKVNATSNTSPARHTSARRVRPQDGVLSHAAGTEDRHGVPGAHGRAIECVVRRRDRTAGDRSPRIGNPFRERDDGPFRDGDALGEGAVDVVTDGSSVPTAVVVAPATGATGATRPDVVDRDPVARVDGFDPGSGVGDHAGPLVTERNRTIRGLGLPNQVVDVAPTDARGLEIDGHFVGKRVRRVDAFESQIVLPMVTSGSHGIGI